METKTTVTIDRKHADQLNKLCKANSSTKKDFICASICYFEKYGINPLLHESPAKEMQQLVKRVDQVIAFIRQQEKDILRPTCEAIFSSEERIKLHLAQIVTKKDIRDQLQIVVSNQKDNNSLLTHTQQAQEKGFKILAKLIDAKEKTGVFSDISKAYGSL